ncbi:MULTISPECIES: hypothetical protein [Methylomonas]|uniref:PEP-CTERM protein-sorting domain-containing protein n=1 Tax=Methylomonas koyamae TaxID=702114 RepID=A0A177PEI0_9GAMM|nr:MULTISPECIES: hypothetical protein [Methylomonas]ANE54318.1 hypothetical protein AYM39_03350 [Methylomonas sp. DH-1]ATG88985.1 hypothetical protein MKLM6_0710 [Methylomonas koyamae]OAI14858.1 hypothetical protein A1507_01255 [Methylomonas koyamae]OAI28591.1 hypothetical protein A1356_06955 [Methylomonas koyamae]
MKMISFFRLWLAVCLFAVSTVSSAGIIWESTDGDSNFLSVSFSSPFPTGDTLGLFSATATVLDSTSLLYSFSGVGSFATSSPFKLGLLTSSGWVGEDANYNLVGNTYLLSFTKPGLSNTLSLLYGFDIKPAANQDPVSSVPLPASVWLMTSALLGFLYAGRNKSNLVA